MSTKETARLPQVAGTTSTRTVVRVDEETQAEAWNRYVSHCGPGLLSHRAEWERVFAVYKLKHRRLAAIRDGQIVGVLPIVWQRSLLFGSQFVSLPWLDAAGVLADDAEVQNALVERAAKMASDAGAQTLLLRHIEPLDLSPHVRTDKLLMRLRLETDPEALWNRLKPKVRNQVRKARKCGLDVERGGAELLPQFFRVYSENMRDLGSPSHSRRFFQAIFDAFPGKTAIYVMRLEKKVIGAGLTIANGDRREISWASSLRRYNSYCVNHLMYWQILEDACRDGFPWFHFGRSSRDSGTYRFKKQWGAEPVQLYWYYLTSNAETFAKASSLQDSYGWGPRLWQHMPLWLSRSAGPRIIAKFP